MGVKETPLTYLIPCEISKLGPSFPMSQKMFNFVPSVIEELSEIGNIERDQLDL